MILTFDPMTLSTWSVHHFWCSVTGECSMKNYQGFMKYHAQEKFKDVIIWPWHFTSWPVPYKLILLSYWVTGDSFLKSTSRGSWNIAPTEVLLTERSTDSQVHWNTDWRTAQNIMPLPPMVNGRKINERAKVCIEKYQTFMN